MFSEIAQFYLVIKAYKNYEELPPLLQKELLTVSGVNIKKQEVLDQKGVHDDWLVMGMMEGIEENLNFRHVWLYGAHTEQLALLLEFSFGNQGYEKAWRLGQAFNGEVVYYPSAYPIRALVKSEKGTVAMFEEPKGFHSLEKYFDDYAKAVSKNPWLFDFPCYLEDVTPVVEKDKLYLVDSDKKYIEALPGEEAAWRIMAMSGGNPINIFGEWSGEYLIPLSILLEGQVIGL